MKYKVSAGRGGGARLVREGALLSAVLAGIGLCAVTGAGGAASLSVSWLSPFVGVVRSRKRYNSLLEKNWANG